MSETEPLRPAVYPGDTDVDDLITRLERETARAEAAEAQLAAAREDGARSIVAFAQAHPEILIEIHQRYEGQPHEFYRNELVAAWRAAQGTEAT